MKNNSTLIRHLLFLLAFFVFWGLYVAPFTLIAAQAADITVPGSSEISEDFSGLSQPPIKEVISLREESVKHFDMGDGTYQAVDYGYPVHYINENGQWQDIDNSLQTVSTRTESKLTTKDSRISLATAFVPNKQLLYIGDSEKSISMSMYCDMPPLLTANKTVAATVKTPVLSPSTDFIDSAALSSRASTVIYRNVLPNVDLEYIVEFDLVKENIVVNAPLDSYQFTFSLSIEGMYANILSDGSIGIYDNNTFQMCYVIPAPYMYDSNDAVSTDVAYSLSKYNEEYHLTVTACEDWINSHERSFPITIDPTVVKSSEEILDTYIDSDNPHTNYGAASMLWVRSNRISYIKAPNLSIPAGSTLNWAHLDAYYFYFDNITSGAVGVGAYLVQNYWAESSLTYSTMYAVNNFGLSSTPLDSVITYANAGATHSSPKQATFDITSAVQSWLTGNSNHGVALKYEHGPNLSVVFKSYESSYEFRPRITCSYSVSHYFNALQTTYGFNANEASMIIDFYNCIAEKYPNENVICNAWRSAGILGSFSYMVNDTLKDSALGVVWSDIVGDIYSSKDEASFFLETLGYSQTDYTNLRSAIRGQHNGSSVYGDFAHMQISLSARLAYHLQVSGIVTNIGEAFTGEDVSYLAGWLGDAVLVENGQTTAFPNDDYISDLDAENIYRVIILGNDIVSASSAYYGNTLNHYSRADIFIGYIDYATVKSKVYYYLIDVYLFANIAVAQSNNDVFWVNYYTQLLSDEEYHQTELQTKYPDTYCFLQSLASGSTTMSD